MHARHLILAATLALAACGGGRVTGDVSKACMSGGRQAANASLCSCVQQAANQTLTAAEQRRAATFFADPQRAQDTRQSGNSSDRAFWTRYRAFSSLAETMCRPA
ncbi:MAG: arginine transporter [Rubellimicrobium sp.]|nr:arginine transporter [Rubellimicrobium sp.]